MDDYDTAPSSSGRRGVGPRLYHKKSRTGCSRCKARRVKCDEARPACGGCSRHQVACVYPPSARTDDHHDVPMAEPQQELQPVPSIDVWAADLDAFSFAPGDALSLLSEQPLLVSGAQSSVGSHPSTTNPLSQSEAARAASTPSNNSSSPGSGASRVREASNYLSHLTDPDILDMPESKERRMWELRLMHNYTLFQARQFNSTEIVARHGEQPLPGLSLEESDLDPNNPKSRNQFGGFIWGREITDLAFKNDSVLYSILTASALEMWTRTSDPKERDHLHLLQQKYQSMALREQRQAVANLNRDNADDICMAALTILQSSFILVQTLPTSPWRPPLEWLRMGKGAGAVLVAAKGYLGFSNGEEKITRFISSMPRVRMEEVFKPEYRTHLTWLLDNDRGSTDNIGDHELVDNQVTLDIYHKVLSYIGHLQKAIDDKEPLYLVHRRFASFAMWMPELYHEFLAQRRPRALITLAHFFKLWIPFSDLWQIGKKTGENQVRGIYEECPVEWRHKLDPIFEEYDLEPPASASPATAQSDCMEEDGS